MAKNYENLEIWKKSIGLATFVYKVTKSFPKDELYGLVSQIRRAVVSIASNIAEGAGRGSQKEFLRFIFIALGSLNELETQFFIAKNLGYIKDKEFEELSSKIKELGNLLGGFRNYLKK